MFITFEGIEGSGKSTQSVLLTEYLMEKGYRVSLTREPGWGKVGSQIRNILLDDKTIELEPFAELCFFCADRAQHVKEFIKPSINRKEIVVCDRYYDSTIVYQGRGRQLNYQLVVNMAIHSGLGVKPDVTFLLDLPVENSLKRIDNRSEITKIDAESIQFHKRIRKGFLELAEKEPNRIYIINADREIGKVKNEIINIAESVLEKSI